MTSRLWIWQLAILALAAVLMPGPVPAANSELTAEQSQGKEIYRVGGFGIVARVTDDTVVSARNFPCANCHGLEGEGGREAGIRVPPLRWADLAFDRPQDPQLKSRAALTEASFGRLVRTGIGADGLAINSLMPRYQLGDDQFKALISYLKVLGTDSDNDPGVSATGIKLGAVLPLTGDMAPIGTDVEKVLQAHFARVNGSGGVYGRRIDLVVMDSRSDEQQAISFARELVERQRVFALVASDLPGTTAKDGNRLDGQVPIIAPINFPMEPIPPVSSRIDILPSFAKQARCLLEFAEAQGARPPRYAVIHGEGAFDMDALHGLASRLKSMNRAMPPALALHSGPFAEDEVKTFLKASNPDYTFYFGRPDSLKAVAELAASEGFTTQFLSTTAMAGDFGATLSSDILNRIWLVETLSSSVESQRQLSVLEEQAKLDIKNHGFGLLAFIAAEAFTDSAKRSGRKLSSAKLLANLKIYQELASRKCGMGHIDANTKHYREVKVPPDP